MDQSAELGRLLYGLQADVGEIKGNLAGILREVQRLAGQVDAHNTENRAAHAAQDERMLGLGGRIAILEQAKAKADGIRSSSRSWAEALRLFAAASMSGIVTWFLAHWGSAQP